MRTALIAVAALWLAAACAGMWWLSRYGSEPGAAALAPQRWPAASQTARRPGEPTLLLFVHPHCACSRASLEELSRLLAEARGHAVDPVVHFLAPRSMGAAWQRSDLWRQATAIPGVTVRADADGREAQLFGAATSGQALLYDAQGRLTFSGGITAARGHSGDSAGHSALLALLRRQPARDAEAAVFGCPLQETDRGGPLSAAPR